MKKNYNLSLDTEAVLKLQTYCKETGQTFSGVVNRMIEEAVKAFEGAPIQKPISEMTMRELHEWAGYWMEKDKENRTED